MAAQQRKGTPVAPAVPVCARCEAIEARYHALVTEMLAMKREGFTVPRETPDPVLMPELPVVIRKAVSDVAKVGSQTWVHLTKLAWDMQRNGDDPEAIAAAIREGEPAEL